MVADKVAGKHVNPVKPESIAGCTYCYPQVASVGMTEAMARDSGLDVKIGRFPFIGNGKAIAVQMDVTKREDNAAAVAATVDAFGMINIGLFNAGLNKPRFFMDIDEDNWDIEEIQMNNSLPPRP